MCNFILKKVHGDLALVTKVTSYPVDWVEKCTTCGREVKYVVIFRDGTWDPWCGVCNMTTGEGLDES